MSPALIIAASLIGWFIFIYIVTKVVFKIDLIAEVCSLGKKELPSSLQSFQYLLIVRQFFLQTEAQIQRALDQKSIDTLDPKPAVSAIESHEALFFFSEWEKKELMACLAKILEFNQLQNLHPYDKPRLNQLLKEVRRSLRKMDAFLHGGRI